MTLAQALVVFALAATAAVVLLAALIAVWHPTPAMPEPDPADETIPALVDWEAWGFEWADDDRGAA